MQFLFLKNYDEKQMFQLVVTSSTTDKESQYIKAQMNDSEHIPLIIRRKKPS